MRIGYIDGAAGVSGDMMLGALVDQGWPLEELVGVVERLQLAEVEVQVQKGAAQWNRWNKGKYFSATYP